MPNVKKGFEGSAWFVQLFDETFSTVMGPDGRPQAFSSEKILQNLLDVGCGPFLAIDLLLDLRPMLRTGISTTNIHMLLYKAMCRRGFANAERFLLMEVEGTCIVYADGSETFLSYQLLRDTVRRHLNEFTMSRKLLSILSSEAFRLVKELRVRRIRNQTIHALITIAARRTLGYAPTERFAQISAGNIEELQEYYRRARKTTVDDERRATHEKWLKEICTVLALSQCILPLNNLDAAVQAGKQACSQMDERGSQIMALIGIAYKNVKERKSPLVKLKRATHCIIEYLRIPTIHGIFIVNRFGEELYGRSARDFARADLLAPALAGIRMLVMELTSGSALKTIENEDGSIFAMVRANPDSELFLLVHASRQSPVLVQSMKNAIQEIDDKHGELIDSFRGRVDVLRKPIDAVLQRHTLLDLYAAEGFMKPLF